LGVGNGGGGRRERRGKRVLAGAASGSSSSPRVQLDTTNGVSLTRFLLAAKRTARLISLVGLPGRKRKKKEGTWARVCMAEFKFKFEFFQTRFES
jgi:hypothetical protein